jgi:hypothetical protein
MEDDQSDATVRISNQDRQRVINRALADFATATNGRFPPFSATQPPSRERLFLARQQSFLSRSRLPCQVESGGLNAVQIKDAVAKCIRSREVAAAMREVVWLNSIFSRDAFTGAIRCK